MKMGDSFQQDPNQDTNSDEFTLLSMPVDGAGNFRGLNDHLVDSATFDLSSDELACKFREILKENMDLKDMTRELNGQLKRQTDHFNILKQQVSETFSLQNSKYNDMVEEAKLKLVEVVQTNATLKMKIAQLEQEKKNGEAEFCAITAQLRQKLSETERNLEKSQKENQRFHVVHLQMKEELNSAQSDWDKLKGKYDELQQQILHKSLPSKGKAEFQDRVAPDRELQQKVKRLEVQIMKLELEKKSLADTRSCPSGPASYGEKSFQEFCAKMQSAQLFLNNYVEGCKNMQSWLSTCHNRLENLPPCDDIKDQLLYEITSLKYHLIDEMDRRNSEKCQLDEVTRFIESALNSQGDHASINKREDPKVEALAVQLKRLQDDCDNVKSLHAIAENKLQSKTKELSEAKAHVEVLQSQIEVLRKEFSEEQKKFDQLSQQYDPFASAQEFNSSWSHKRGHNNRSGRHSANLDTSVGLGGRPGSGPQGMDTPFQSIYSCPKCGFTLKNLHELNNHMDTCLSLDD